MTGYTMTTAGAAAVFPSADLKPALFNDFIQFIDRGEKTTKTYITNLKQFVAWLRYKAITRPIRSDVIAYRDYLAAEHEAIQIDTATAAGWTYRTDSAGRRYTITCKPATVAQYLRSVAQFFRWTAANGFYPNIAENIHGPKIRNDAHKKEALTAADVLQIEQTISLQAERKAQDATQAAKDPAGRFQRATEQGARLYAMYSLAVNAGLRTVEISRANIRDLETINGVSVLYIWGKGHSEPDQKKTLAPEVRAAIDEYLALRTDKPTGAAPLFVSTGNRSGGQRIASTTISKMLKKAMQAAGYDSERITAHSLRHTAGNIVMELTGDNLFITQTYMRHTDPKTTEIYLHRDTERQEAEIAKELYNRYHGITTQDGNRTKLESIINGMTPAQIEQLTSIARAIAR